MKTILVIEDESSIADLLCAILEDAGYHVIVAAHGQEGLDLIQVERPDMILSDVMMPEMDGRALVRAIHADPAYHHIPVILMSAGIDKSPEFESSIAAFLRKPFPIDDLLKVVQETIG